MVDAYQNRVHHEPMNVADITSIDTAEVRLAALQRTLELAGWELVNVDINVTGDRARVELKRGDLHVTFDGDSRSHMIERETLRWVEGAKRYSGRWDRVLLGRSRVPIGWRGGLRLLCTYLAENGTRELEAARVRAALAPLMG